jgi:hypothetical protein
VAGVLAIAALSLVFIAVYDEALREAASRLGASGALPAELLDALSGSPLPTGALGDAGRAALFGAFQAVALVGAACAACSGVIAWRMMGSGCAPPDPDRI